MSKKKNKNIVHVENNCSKTPVIKEEKSSYLDKNPVWSFKKMDEHHERWSISNVSDVYSSIISKLKSYEGMTWDEILKAAGGRTKGNNNHFESVDSVSKSAQERWKELKLEEYDSLFSLRLTGTNRLIGILDDGIFYIIWFDKDHEVYKVKKD